MCDLETVLVSICLILLSTASFCIHRVFPGKKIGHHSKIGGQAPFGNEYTKYCLNGGECYYLIDEDIAGCNCTWLYGGKRCEKFMRCT